jgi:hypothetical protein
MPVRARAVRLETRHDPHREVTLTGQRADLGGDRAAGDAGDLAEQDSSARAMVQQLLSPPARLGPEAERNKRPGGVVVRERG